MPRGDGTGPMGQGSMTGRAAGYCAGFAVPGSQNTAGGRGGLGWQGRGFRGGGWGGRGGGGGWGRRNQFYATGLTGWQREAVATPEMTADHERNMLKSQAEYFESALDEIKNRLEELETGPKG